MGTDENAVALQLVGGPTAVLEYGGVRFLTDPTFDPPGDYEPRPGISMEKHQGPAMSADEVGEIDAVLLSHDHHVDNLDDAGREFLKGVGLVLTTPSGAERLKGSARGLPSWNSWEVQGRDGSRVLVTAVPAQHGPDGTDHITGEVTGFYLSSRGLPTVYVSGDNASLGVVRTIVRELGSAPVAVLNTGAARMSYLGESDLTLSASRAVKAARLLGARQVIPIHFEGWAHFSQGAEELRAAFELAGSGQVLRIPEPGRRLTVEPAARLRIAVVGASGVVGSAIVREALARGHEALAISRNPTSQPSDQGLSVLALDAAEPELTEAIRGCDALVGSVSARREGRPELTPQLAGRLLAAAEAAAVARLLWVGGAASLEVVPGLRLLDTPEFPSEIHPEASAQAEALGVFRESKSPVQWGYFSPAAELDAEGDGGEDFGLAATDSLQRDEDGRSRIALADYARAAVDELEAPRFNQERFTIAAGISTLARAA